MNLMEHPYFKNGYYRVGNQVFSSKLLALMAGSQSNIHPEWIFNNNIFDAVDWTKEPALDIDSLYLNRASAIREKYDYVVLMYSGGADSHNVLKTFLRNNLRIDEIVTTWSVEAAKKYVGDPTDRSAANYLAEWNYLLEPQLKYIATHYPDIKITVVDSTTDIANNCYCEEDFFLFDHFHNLPGMNRWPALVRKLKEIGDQHPNSIMLTGVDKPQFNYDKNQLHLFFIDMTTAIKSQEGVNIEYFYWSADAVNIVKKQCHMVLQYFKNNPELKPMLTNRNDALLRIINTVVYPTTFDPERFQSGKQKYMLFNDQQKWAWNLTQFQDGSYVDRWSSQIANFNLIINDRFKRYKDGLFDGYHGFLTKDYFIGNL